MNRERGRHAYDARVGPALPSGALWHPFADMSAISRELVLVSGEGAYVTDSAGRRYLDATAALWYCNVGHGRRSLADAASKQMATLASYSIFGDLAVAPALDLAERLASLSDLPDAKVFLTSGGSDAVDTAVKMTRRYWSLVGEPSRQWIITRERGYHGMHMAGTSLSGIAMNRDGYGDLDEKVATVAWDDASALEAVIGSIGAGNIAAFFCEPIIGAGGVYAPPEGYLAQVRAICRKHGVLFVADEVITGYGRTGSMFASHRWGLEPDLILSAKGLSSGYVPMGAVIVTGRVAEPFWTSGVLWRHGYTYSGHAAAAAVAMANLDIIEQEQLVARVAEHELTLAAALLPLRSHGYVHDVRAGTGLLAAVQLAPDWLASDPGAGMSLIRALRERGVLTRLLADGGLQISPAFIATREDFRLLSDAIDDALRSLGSTSSSTAPGHTLLPEVTQDEVGGFGSNTASLRENVPPHHG